MQKPKKGCRLRRFQHDLRYRNQRYFVGAKGLNPQRHRCKPRYKIDEAALRQAIEAYPDSDCHEKTQGLGVSATGIRDAQYRLGITDKKNVLSPQSRPRKKTVL